MGLPTRTVHRIRLCEDRRADIISEPEGDFNHAFFAELRMSNEPTVEDVLKAAEGRWIYRPVRVSIYIDKPPVDVWLSVHTHHSLSGVKRGYLLPSHTVIEPLIVPDEYLEGGFRGQLLHCCQQIVFATLPGDRIFLTLRKKEPLPRKDWKCSSAPPSPPSLTFFSWMMKTRECLTRWADSSS